MSNLDKGKRKVKRQIIDDDDDDDDVKDPLEQLAQLASVAARSRATSTASRYVSPDDDQPKPSTSKAARPSKKLKKRKAEDEEEDYEVDIEALNDDLATMAPELEFDDDSTFEDDEVPRRKKPAAKAPAKGARAGKGKAGSSKAKPPDKPILMKDERKTPVIKSGIAPPPAKRLKKNEDDELTSPLSAKDPSLPVSAPRKKLPNIKKNKDTASATSTPPPPLTRVANKPATQTTVDLDLNDSSIYGQLFNKSAGGNTPRSGLNRAEERKAEINKMRQEARAKRELEARCHFNLQADTEKILRYEESLRSNRSSVLYPNIMGAKWKEEYDRAARYRVTTNGNGVVTPQVAKALGVAPDTEEGEMMSDR
ncbi:hypothetical protein CPB85DRAFT_1428293 [Mucidula mucida]|nr:hypothetical protein CPB85DRAFT_1428293 [Mucidula mucida]